MGHIRHAFLLIELLILILLVTLLISLFIGGQAHLIRVQSEAAKKLQELDSLLNQREALFQRQTNNTDFLQVECCAVTKPSITTDFQGTADLCRPKIVCHLFVAKRQNQLQNKLWLPLIGCSKRTGTP